MHWITVACLLVAFEASLGIRNFSCPRVKLKNGHVKLRQRGRFVEFLCNKGFLRAGERFAICAQGEWDTTVPKCVRPTCFPVKPPPNGLIYPSHSGGVLTFYCKHGYDLRGHSIVFCDGKSWDNNSPACLPSDTKPALSCDFESEDLCHWTHDFNNDFTWTRYKYYTPSGRLSIGTGPSYDHTKQNSDGYYMYIESSSRNANDWARLISPIYDKTTTNTCFEFYYHMYGTSIGELRVFLKKVSQDWSLKRSSAFFIKEGNQGNHWFRSITELGPINEDFQIVIEGVRGDSYISDIAIDDVKLILDCDLSETTSITSTTAETWETEKTFIVESCYNRCGAVNDTTTPASSSTDLIVCDCDSECYFRSRCCPDYYDLCVFRSTSESTEQSDEYTTENFTSSDYTETTELIEASTLYQKVAFIPVKKDIQLITQKFTPERTVKTTRNIVTTTTIRPTTFGIWSTRIPTTIKMSTVSSTPVTTNTATTAKVPSTTTTKDHINTESEKTTTQRKPLQRRTFLPLVLKKEVEEGAMVALDTLMNDIEHISFKPPPTVPKTSINDKINSTKSPSIEDNSEVTEVDEVEIPWQSSDEGSIEGDAPDKTDAERYAERKDQIDKQMKNEINRDFFIHGKHEHLLVKPEPPSIHWEIIIICCSLVTIVGTIGSIVLYRKYRGWPYSKRIMRLRRSRQGSQSDVFFLTNDEQLNFTLNYDSL